MLIAHCIEKIYPQPGLEQGTSGLRITRSSTTEEYSIIYEASKNNEIILLIIKINNLR